MNYLKKPSWQLKEKDITPKELFDKRRTFIKLGAASIVSSAAIVEALAKENLPIKNLKYNEAVNNNLELNTYEQITSYNNFYEFTTSKERVKYMAHTLDTNDWKITIDGLIDKEIEIDFDDLIKKFTLHERIYRFRCVEGWSMVVPWVGIKLSDFIKYVNPNSKAKYIRFETLFDDDMFPDQANMLFPAVEYPYVEGLRMDEAMNDLSILAVGLYGSSMPKQNGAPIRLIVPWKYGLNQLNRLQKYHLWKKSL